jgi:nucleoside-diphosphate-sugar epimerase
MKVIITGGSGLFGRHLVAHLMHEHEITIVDVVPPPVPGHHFIQQDIKDLEGLINAFSGHDAVIHLAAIPHPLADPPGRIYETNVLGTHNVLEAAARVGIGRLVYASSESTFGLVFNDSDMVPSYVPLDESHPCRPTDPYGMSKLMGEDFCRGYAEHTGMAIFALRPCWIWTPEEITLVKRLVSHPEEWKKSHNCSAPK